jgi:hypothetical protein
MENEKKILVGFGIYSGRGSDSRERNFISFHLFSIQ